MTDDYDELRAAKDVAYNLSFGYEIANSPLDAQKWPDGQQVRVESMCWARPTERDPYAWIDPFEGCE